MDIENDIEERYREMLIRCGAGDYDIPEEEEENTEIIEMGDIDAYGPKPELTSGIGTGIKFERIRRITGYLVGDVSRWNNGKFSELKDRVKHG